MNRGLMGIDKGGRGLAVGVGRAGESNRENSGTTVLEQE